MVNKYPHFTKAFSLVILFILSCFFMLNEIIVSDLLQPRINIVYQTNSSIYHQSIKTKKVAIYVQAFGLTDPVVWSELHQCIANVGKAKTLADNFTAFPWDGVKPPVTFQFDVLISYPSNFNISSTRLAFRKLGAKIVFRFPIVRNEGLDIKQFLDQLQFTENTDRQYDYFLKIHTKTRVDWRRKMYEALCGSPAAVLTVLRAFQDNDENIGMVLPQGLAITKSTDKSSLIPIFRDNPTFTPDEVFSGVNMENMKLLFREMYGRELDDESKYVCSAGTMFWSRYRDFPVDPWLRIMPWLATKWTQGYSGDSCIEHSIERLFITIPHIMNVTIAEIAPPVKPIAMYMPQYRLVDDVTNSNGSTQWSLLGTSKTNNLIQPLSKEDGGLGYYDQTNLDIRRRQGEMAKSAGLHGFLYSHYWFGGNTTGPVMGEVQDLMLEDGHPDIPFMFNWINGPWNGHHQGEDTVITQEYGGEEEWEKHFNYLLPFFLHSNYMKADGKPILVINRVGHLKSAFEPMLGLWKYLAVQNGLHGLHIVYVLNEFISVDKVFEEKYDAHCDASFQHLPSISKLFPTTKSSSESDISTPSDLRQYWGAYTSFNNLVHDSASEKLPVSPKQFSDDFRHSLEQILTVVPRSRHQINVPNLFFIMAWNNWVEQAVLEPCERYGFSFLSAVKENLENLPLAVVH